MRGMCARIVLVMMLVACGGSKPPPRRPPEPTDVTRSHLPAEILRLLPQHGVYLAGGGDKSPVFRVIVDTDKKTIYTGSAPAGSALHGAMSEERTRELTPPNEQHLMTLCAEAWGEPAPAEGPDPVAGYDEFLVVADGDKVFLLRGHGPIKRPRAVKAIEALRAAAALVN